VLIAEQKIGRAMGHTRPPTSQCTTHQFASLVLSFPLGFMCPLNGQLTRVSRYHTSFPTPDKQASFGGLHVTDKGRRLLAKDFHTADRHNYGHAA